MKGHQNTANENSKENCERIRKLCSLIREDMQPALGVTEPAAIALAAAYARSYKGRDPGDPCVPEFRYL